MPHIAAPCSCRGEFNFIKNLSRLTFEQFVNLRLLLSLEGIGPGRLKKLLQKLRTVENVLAADVNTLVRIEGINQLLAQRIKNSHKQRSLLLSQIENEVKIIESLGASIVTIWDKEYPWILKKIFDPPLILYILGSLSEEDQNAVAVVGTRNPTAYGKKQAGIFSAALSVQNITVVSGMARGIDSIAHRAALKNGGRTIAVTGSGLDVIYPPENRDLFREISRNGAVISEYEPGTKPDAMNFPRRNRIISGLALGTLVVETMKTGGAMQTAAFALEQGREVFAVPGSLDNPQSSGTNQLIQKGEAKLVCNAEDILTELQLKYQPVEQSGKKEVIDLNIFEDKLLQVLDSTPKQVDVISVQANMEIPDCLVNLLSLEFKGLVRQLPGKMFTIADTLK